MSRSIVLYTIFAVLATILPFFRRIVHHVVETGIVFGPFPEYTKSRTLLKEIVMEKMLLTIVIAAVLGLFVTACSSQTIVKGDTTMETSTIFEKGVPAGNKIFTNAVWVNMLLTDPDKVYDTQAYNVTFSPAARTFWHSHPGGQILLCTSGTGYYQAKDDTARILKPGDVVHIPPDVVHWHGAAPDSEFVHLGMSTNVNLGPADWFGPVTDEEYNKATAPGSAWDKTFELSGNVTHTKVTYPNRFGITVSGDMYTPKDMDASGKYPALLVGTPYGGVKEQGAGIYAMNMAERGFIAIAFDESYNGESTGKPRCVSSPDIFVEDFSAGVDFLGTLPFVDREKIGVIGICGSGAFSLTAAQVDHRIKAVATASMYDMSRFKHNGWMDSMTDEERNAHLDGLAEQRWKDVEAGTPELTPAFPNKPADTIPEGLDPITSEFFEYYAMKRGFHPRSIAAFTKTSDMSFMNFPLLNYIKDISPRPILFIMGEKAHSRYFTEDAYKMAAERS